MCLKDGVPRRSMEFVAEVGVEEQLSGDCLVPLRIFVQEDPNFVPFERVVSPRDHPSERALVDQGLLAYLQLFNSDDPYSDPDTMEDEHTLRFDIGKYGRALIFGKVDRLDPDGDGVVEQVVWRPLPADGWTFP